MALSNLFGWNNSKKQAPSACGTACGASKPEDAPASACGASKPEEKPATSCGSACGASK
ncbi:MAG: ACGX-repeat peptide [Spirochaetales bacterium]|nr:ACGX-repeat peptide [Spirochaetales bacterium]